MANEIAAESAGTSGFHVGEAPDPRMRQAMAKHGINMNGSARQFKRQDFYQYDLILAMDSTNYADIRYQAPHNELTEKVKLFLSFDEEGDEVDVLDPYYGGQHGFEHVYRLVERTCYAMIRRFRDGSLF